MISHDERVRACSAIVKRWQDVPLMYGTWDCANMCRDLAIELGLPDPMSDWPEYNSKRGARDSLKKMGFKDLTEAVTSKLTKLDGIGFIMPSDIVEIKSGVSMMNALGIFLGIDAVLVFGMAGDDIRVQRIDMQYATGNAWRLG